jgi:SAM-dependent methyltransferase
MRTTEIQDEINKLNDIQPWNHNFELPNGLQTSQAKQESHGKNLVKYKRISSILDSLNLANKNVLDMGCNEGFFSLKMEEMGAKVTSIDIDEHRIEKANFIKNLLKPDANIEYRELDIYSEDLNNLSKFDICLCLGFIHRIPDPFRAVSLLASKSDIIIFEWKALKFGSHDESFAFFSTKDIDHEDYYGTEYWLLSYKALERILVRSGFKNFHRIDDPRQRRAILVAGKVDHDIFDLEDNIFKVNKIRSLLSHTKRYLSVLWKIITGKLNG